MKIEEMPIGWEVDLLYLFAHSATILAEDIDQQLKIQTNNKDGFVKKKKKCLDEYEDCIKKARIWLQKGGEAMDKFDLEGATFDATDRHSNRYSNVIASANELIRASMLVVDRSHCDGGSARVFKRLRSLPENGVFPESFIERFQMKYELVPEVGDRIENPNHGQGVLQLHLGNKNWQCVFDNGGKVVLNEKLFKLL